MICKHFPHLFHHTYSKENLIQGPLFFKLTNETKDKSSSGFSNGLKGANRQASCSSLLQHLYFQAYGRKSLLP